MNDSIKDNSSHQQIEYTEILSKLIPQLDDKKGVIRHSAREKIVSLGTVAVEYLAELLENPKKIIRWEAVKALAEIADPASAPLFILALEDKDEDIRWIAAVGLIILGPISIKPIFESLIQKPDSLFLRKGAHHVLNTFSKKGIGPDAKSLIKALESTEANLLVPVEVEKVLSRL